MVTKRIDITETSLQELLKLVRQGEEVVLIEDEEAFARLLPVQKERIAGLHEGVGEFWMSDDFDAPLDDEFDFNNP